jgi:ABC-type transport system involved in multi-copper enzyme maturation permease subunit
MSMDLAVIGPMIGAEILKLRRNRAIMIVAGLLTIGVLLLAYGVSAIQHSSNPAQNAPAGGEIGFSHGVRLLGVFFGALAAALIGSEAGTADISSGVFRDLVATGRSRLELFFVRLPAAVVVTFAFNLAGVALAAVLSLVFADGLPNPSLTEVLQSVAWVLLCNTVVCAFAVGVGSVTGSRGVSLTAVIGWQAVATPLLLHIRSLGSLRDVISIGALGQLMPVSGDIAGITMGTGVAVFVILGWFVIPSAIGAWSTATRDA